MLDQLWFKSLEGKKEEENRMNKKIKRKCEVCNQSFKPMTENQWRIVKYEHETLSERHKKYVQLMRSKLIKQT